MTRLGVGGGGGGSSGNELLRAEEKDKGGPEKERKKNNFLLPGRENGGSRILKMRMFSYMPEITQLISGHVGFFESCAFWLQNSCSLRCNAMGPAVLQIYRGQFTKGISPLIPSEDTQCFPG